MYRTLIIPLLVVIFMLGGCSGTATNNGQQKKEELAELRSQVSWLQQELSIVTEDRDQMWNEMHITRDSLRQIREQNTVLTERAEKAELQLIFARSEFKKAFANFDMTLESCRTVKDEYEAENDLLCTENSKLYDTVSLQAEQITELNTSLDASQQWTDYYKKVADRNILKHLFGAGKPPLPNVPYPGD